MTLVDSNVLLDLVTDDPRMGGMVDRTVGSGLSHRAIDHQRRRLCGTVRPVSSDRRAGRDDRHSGGIDGRNAEGAALPCGKVFQLYRRVGGTRTGVLPDFFIGAHAAVSGLPLITRDPGRYRTYFPKIRLVTP